MAPPGEGLFPLPALRPQTRDLPVVERRRDDFAKVDIATTGEGLFPLPALHPQTRDLPCVERRRIESHAHATNWLIRSGWFEPWTFSNSSAGPPALTVRSLISVTSSWGSTSAPMRTSYPSRSRRSIHSCGSLGGAIARVSLGLVRARELRRETACFHRGRRLRRSRRAPPRASRRAARAAAALPAQACSRSL
jgi:hypothetical protein